MRAGRAQSCEIDSFPARKLRADMRQPRVGELGAELVKSRSPHGFRSQPAREA